MTVLGPDPDTLRGGGVVVLDAHGVVINNPLAQFLRDLGDRVGIGGDELVRRWRARWRQPFWEGAITEAEMWEAIAPGLDPDELRADLEARYRRGPWFEFVLEHAGPVWLLSNHRTAWLLPRLERFGVADRFERILVSDVLGAAKPSPDAFALLRALPDAVFFDDSPWNVAAARALGITAHVVEPPVADPPTSRSRRATVAAVADSTGFIGSQEALTALDHVRHFVGLLSPDGTLLEANAAALQAGGVSRDDVVGRPFWEAHWWSHSAETRRRLREAIEAARGGTTVHYDVDVMAADEGRSLVTIDFRLTPVRSGDGVIRYLVPEGAPLAGPATVGVDSQRSWAELVADLTAARAQNDALRTLASSLAASRTVDEVCTAIADTLGPTVGAVFGNIAIAPPSGEVLQLFMPTDMDRGVAARWVTVPLDHTTPLGTAMLTGRPVHVSDQAAIAAQFPLGADDAGQIGLQAMAAHPVTVTGGSVRAAIGLAWDSPTAALDQAAIDPAIALCGAALQRAWVSDESTRLAALLDTLLTQAPVGFAFIDRDFRFSHVNTRLAETNGLSVAEHLGRSLHDVVPHLAEQIVAVLRRVFDDGESPTGIEISGETRARPGETRVWEEGFYPVRVPGVGIIGAGVIVVEVTEQRREREALQEVAAHEREIARRLQAGLLPTAIPDVEGYEVCARYQAGTAGLRVGGDWYEVVEIGDGDIAIVVGDAVGHDLDAAIAMSQIRNALTGLSHAHDDPATVVERLDEYAAHTPDAFASTLFYARLDQSTGALRYTLAGHHPPLLLHADGDHAWFDAEPGPPIGLSTPRTTAVCQLGIGDSLVCYTDGLVEYHGEPIEAGRQRLLDVATAAADTALASMVDDLLARVPNNERPDDIVLLALRRTG